MVGVIQAYADDFTDAAHARSNARLALDEWEALGVDVRKIA
jgi:hypothetical protein